MNLWDSASLAQALGPIAVPDSISATGVSIDTRSLQKGDIFIALRGPNFDGHDFVAKAIAQGAACVMVDRNGISGIDGAVIRCADTYAALWDLARYRLRHIAPKVIAVTGSVGKTSTKEALGLIFAAQGPTHFTTGNLNNAYGLPLTCARMPASTQYCILEMGMNHAGEIAPLSNLARPDIAIITTIAPVHLENFTGMQGLAQAKAEIFAGMQEGTHALIDVDSEWHAFLADQAKNLHIHHFGMADTAEYRLRATKITKTGTTAKVQIASNGYNVHFLAQGAHLAKNIVAALGAAHLAGLDLPESIAALRDWDLLQGRGKRNYLKIFGHSITVIDESYNASPKAVTAAIETMAHVYQGRGRLIAVLGDMGELGAHAQTMHADLATPLQHANIAKYYLCGDLMKNLAAKVQGACIHRRTAQELLPDIVSDLRHDDVLLVKGSLSMGMKTIVDALIAKDHDEG
ncbi:MAG: UDP-N-acetylmuramoyl-tripeptide--D-alanyl-D-alanine ligase [Pseudomonadota bacterium]